MGARYEKGRMPDAVIAIRRGAEKQLDAGCWMQDV
jgi:hypothetical protein